MDEKQKEIKTKSASGIWTWIFCLLFASAVIVVVIHLFWNYIWYVLTGKPYHMTVQRTVQRTDIMVERGITGYVIPIRDKDTSTTDRAGWTVPDGSSSGE